MSTKTGPWIWIIEHRGQVGLGLAAIAFAASVGHWPLFFSNQHTYLLHGIAPASEGLRHDWLASTADLQPVFSALVGLTHAIDDRLLHVVFASLAALFAIALLDIARQLERELGLVGGLAIVAGLLVVHADRGFAAGRLRHLLFHGHAGQPSLGEMLEPASFSVLLVVGVALAMRRRLRLAALSFALAATVHPTYLASAAVLALALAIGMRARGGDTRESLTLVALTALLCSPIALYLLAHIGPLDAAAAAILHERVRAHADLTQWWGPDDAVKLGLLTVAIALSWRRELGPALAVAGASSLGATLLFVAAPPEAQLWFPHRVSVVLTPIATIVVAARLAASLQGLLTARAVQVAAAVACLAMSVWALRAGTESWTRAWRGRAEPMMHAVSREVPTSGVVAVLPPELREDVRLRAGRAVFVDRKSHPFRSEEVHEWHRRLLAARHAYATCDVSALATVSHVLVPRGWCGPGQTVWSDTRYELRELAR